MTQMRVGTHVNPRDHGEATWRQYELPVLARGWRWKFKVFKRQDGGSQQVSEPTGRGFNSVTGITENGIYAGDVGA